VPPACDSPADLLARCAFLLVEPAGAANVGAVARALQCFGLADLRLVAPGPNVVESASASHFSFAPEAYEYSVSARPLLDACSPGLTLGGALADATLVLATSARPRESRVPVWTPRAAAASAMAEAARGGRVALLFGNERTGLRNEHLELAHAVVAVPTAAPAPAQGASGRYSLNLSHAAALIAYELHTAAENDSQFAPLAAPAQPAPMEDDSGAFLSTEAREVLVTELMAARNALTLLPLLGESADAATEAAERLLDARSLRRCLSLGPLRVRDAAPLFALARRVVALQQLRAGGAAPGLLDDAVLAASRAALAAGEGSCGAEATLRTFLRAPPRSLNLSRRELRRVLASLQAGAGRVDFS
jgi:TrmH family RNA methyltransferase